MKAVQADDQGPQSGRTHAGLLSGGAFKWRMARWRGMVDEIATFEPTLQNETDHQLKKRGLSLRFRAKSGEKLDRLLPEAYALVREAAVRSIGMRHFDVQVFGGIALFRGNMAEMETGEGKTLTATLPLYLHSLSGKGAHLATVNDYLAARDAEWMSPVYRLLGLTVGVIQSQDTQDQRREAYACDITYGTAKEFGFDFLRDRLLLRRMGRQQGDFLGEGSTERWDDTGEQPVQRSVHFALVDEADSVLIDEARTPLIIGSLGEEAREQVVATYQWAAKHAPEFEEEEHYDYEHETKKVELTATGRQVLRSLTQPDILRAVGLIDLYQYMERAIKVHRDFHLDREYVVRDGEIVIVDEFTGRLAEGRKWRDGIHQAIEAQEEVEVTVPTGQAARITVQDLFLRYRHLAGMTGTARSSAREFRKIYKARVVQIPTNKPVRRHRLAACIYGTAEAKWRAIAEEIREMHELGRPVLIGTRSIDKSEHLSQLLSQNGIDHQVLNAREVAKEAKIVERAGEAGKVTVATNMAGRGTDIKLGEGVAENGGLHVILTEMHDAARIDRQLCGRCGRQGDLGTFRYHLSLEDDIIQSGFGRKRADRYRDLGAKATELVDNCSGIFRKAQKKVERRHFRDRSVLLHHEKQRKKMQREMGQDPYLDTPD
ncbi:MAG: preprotein translocase subunit SecA [Planctomycetes bacterium]|nr:preprotein translocase subunit SecA [Planctomycetota bacterium]MBL7038966.1 preprotein translocase subunit SecA [Pirellulaceae bacterium]